MKPVLLVTGASRGIGAAIARGCAREGALVVVNYLRNQAAAEDVAQVLLEEFRSWFGVETAGDLPAYRALAADIWSLQERRDA